MPDVCVGADISSARADSRLDSRLERGRARVRRRSVCAAAAGPPLSPIDRSTVQSDPIKASDLPGLLNETAPER